MTRAKPRDFTASRTQGHKDLVIYGVTVMSRFRSLLYLCMDKESLLSVAFPCIFELYCLHGHCTGVATSAYADR